LANGLGSSQLPEIGAQVPDGIKQYPDQPLLENRVDDTGLMAIRQEKVALIPSRADTFILPEVEIPWWNTRTDQLEYARLPARPIDVLPAAGAPAATETPPDAPPVSVEDGAEVATAVAPDRLNSWAWLSFGLALGWLATSLLWFWNRRHAKQAQPRTMPAGDKTLLKNIRQACAASDASATKDALLAWAARHWPGSRVSSLGELAARIDGDLQVQIHGLGQCLYSDAAGTWDGAPLWQAFSERQARKRSKVKKPEPELEPLYL
jgi:hypothetical protein